ncbi:unnamed protein product [Alternaria alternata]
MVIYSTILGAIIGSGVLAVPVLGAPAALASASVPAAAGARLGGIDMNRACRDQYGMGYPAGTIGNGHEINIQFEKQSPPIVLD